MCCPRPFVIRLALALALLCLLLPSPAEAASAKELPYPGHSQHSNFPMPLAEYNDDHLTSVWEKIKYRAKMDPFNVVASVIFLCAIIHTFVAGMFIAMAHHQEARHQRIIQEEGRTAEAKPHEDAIDDVSFRSTALHFLGEVEAVFGIWIIPLALSALYFHGWSDLREYIGHDVKFTEPLFVIVIMAIAASRPVIRLSEQALQKVADIGGGTATAWWLSVLTLAPILGSFITEPAAMTIGALLLAKKFFELKPSRKFAYATLGLLFVNVSVGGTLTHFAAPPILMVAEKFGWGTPYVFMNFGWKAVIGILIANAIYFAIFRGELKSLGSPRKASLLEVNRPMQWHDRDDHVPLWITLFHVFFLAWTVLTSHYPPLFIGGFLFFFAFVQGTQHHQNDIHLATPMLVGFFLAGLVIHGGLQGWWIEPILTSGIDDLYLMLGAAGLTAVNDNAAITFLAAQVPDLSEAAKQAVVAGAVAGGGLTVIANAPNPAGQSILGRFYKGGVSPLHLLAGAAIPTAIVFFTLRCL